jgi:hypothetical protein
MTLLINLLINDFTINDFHVSKFKHICNGTFITVISKVIITKVYIPIVIVSFCKDFSYFFKAIIQTFEIHV